MNRLRISGELAYHLTLRKSTLNYCPAFGGNYNPVDGNWHHIAATYDKTNFTCYIDGLVDGETPRDLQPDAADTVITIGSWVGGGWLQGTLDEVALYNHALSEADIQQVMTGATPVESKGKLATYWGRIKVTD